MAANTISSESCSVTELRDKLNNREAHQIFIDVRTAGEFKGANIHGLENIPLGEIEKNIDRLGKYSEIYVSCHNGMRTNEAVKKLQKRGFNAISIDGGIVAWRKAGFPVAAAASASGGSFNVISIMRQVQIIFGLLCLSGLVLSHFVHPGFIALTIFVGCGLLIAGSTGWCGFAMALEKLPWNK